VSASISTAGLSTVAAGDDAGAVEPVQAAYVHVPFCRHRCGYCDFTLVARRDDLVDPYLTALERELRQLQRPRPVRTLFLGGGTPTHLPPAPLRRLMQLLAEWLPREAGSEFSIEANPSGLDDERLEVLAAAGVNRVSLGVQSFDSRHLATLERDHRPEEIADVVRRLRPWCGHISLDLIFAVPGQSLADWEATLEAAIALGCPHISTYGLTWERGTSYWSRKLRGTLSPVDEETERAMYALAMDRLPQTGIDQYELSNFARPGFECRHNQVYWRGESYWGFGPGAASYLGGVRRLNHRSVTTWITRTLTGATAIDEHETLSPEERAREAIMLGLRQCRGIEIAAFTVRYGAPPRDLEPAAYQRFLDLGLCEEVDGRWRLTRAGRFVADCVMSEFL
jgi:oxygen-independent coproporphyrinogen-3 oxidase